MKQFIVLIAMVILGCYIFGLVTGDNDKSVKGALTGLWKAEIVRQSTYP